MQRITSLKFNGLREHVQDIKHREEKIQDELPEMILKN